jgi:hypothetical protein
MSALALEPGALVHVRQRRWVIESVGPLIAPGDSALVDLAGIDDNAQGQPLSVLWQIEPNARELVDICTIKSRRHAEERAMLTAAFKLRDQITLEEVAAAPEPATATVLRRPGGITESLVASRPRDHSRFPGKNSKQLFVRVS